MTIRNAVLDQLKADELSLGVIVRYARTVDVAKAMRACGMDWLFLDLEHSAMTLDTAAQISVAALSAGIAPFVRVPAMQLGMACRALDGGALGVLLPHVDTAEEAQAIARALRYPPFGQRSTSSTLPHFDFAPPPLAEAIRQIDAATLVAVILETPKAIANVDAIAAVAGIDVLMIGGSDLTLEMGLHDRFDDPRVVSAFERVVAAGRRHGKAVGMGGVGDDAMVERFCKMGVRMIAAGSDMSFLMSAATRRTAALRERLR
jgi:2-keto-3-deoxy-L-rhamnonate aldolase RhmA